MKIVDKFSVVAFFFVLLLSVVSGLCEAALFYVLYVFIGGEDKNLILTGQSIENIFLLLVITTTTIRLCTLVAGATITRLLCNRLVKKVLNAFNNTDYLFKKTSDLSELMGVIVTRVASIQAHLFQSGINGLAALIQTTFTLIVIVYVSDIALSKLLVIVLVYLVLIISIYWRIKKIGEQVSKKTSEQFSELKSYISNIKYFLIRDRLPTQANKIIEVDFILRKLGASMTILNGLPKIFIELSLFVILFLVSEWATSESENILPEIILFLTAALRLVPLMQIIYSSSITIVSAIPNFKVTQEKLSLYSKQIEKVSNRHSDKFETLKLLDINFSVEEKEILKDVSLSFSAGEKLIILGPSGSGKSTLVEIICGLISPPNMQVLFNGKKVETINDALWRRKIAYIDQEGTLSARNLREVFDVFEKRDLDEKAIKNLLTEFKLSQLADKPNFLDVDYGDDLNLLSGGQRARVKICAAILSKSEIIILDETLASVDDNNDLVIINSLKNQTATIILISHKSYHHSDFKLLVDLNG